MYFCCIAITEPLVMLIFLINDLLQQFELCDRVFSSVKINMPNIQACITCVMLRYLSSNFVLVGIYLASSYS